MKISPFTPLHFGGDPESDGLPSRYVQLFASTDQIMVQVFADSGETLSDATLKDAHGGAEIGTVGWNEWEMNEDKSCFFLTLHGLSPGHYILNVGGVDSDEFIVTDDEQLLSRTMLIQYRFKDNRQRDDVVSVIHYVPFFFDWRVPGGFKDSGWTFGVSNEQFVTQREDVVELFAMDYVTKAFTMGGPEGVPVWYGELLNRLLTCSYVYFDGVRYTRNESETPSMSVLVDGMDSFVFTQSLRKAVALDPEIEELNQTVLRRIDSTYYREAEVDSENNTNRLIL